jgi:hypothetical protein
VISGEPPRPRENSSASADHSCALDAASRTER